MISRWSFHDVNTGETWTMPMNPNSMSSPHQDRAISTSYGSRWGVDRLRSFMTPTPAIEWSFGGTLRTQDHYDHLLDWSKRDRKIRVSDHLGRVFEVLMESLESEEKPTPNAPARRTYTMKTLLLRRIT